MEYYFVLKPAILYIKNHMDVMFSIQVHAFIAMEAAALDDLTFNLPVMQENGNGVTIINRALQSLDDYCTRMPTEPL